MPTHAVWKWHFKQIVISCQQTFHNICQVYNKQSFGEDKASITTLLVANSHSILKTKFKNISRTTFMIVKDYWLTQNCTVVIIIIILITMTMFMVLSLWHSHCESSPGSFDECRLSAGWPPTLRPNQPIRAVSPPIGCYHLQRPSPFIIITQLVSWYSCYRPKKGGRLSRPKHCSKGAQPVPKAVYCSDCRDKHDRPWWDSTWVLSHRSRASYH